MSATRSTPSATRPSATRRSELFYRYSSYGEPDAEIEMAYYFWVLRRGGRDDPRRHGLRPGGRRAARPNVPRRRRSMRCAGSGSSRESVSTVRRDAPPLRPHREPRRVPAGAADRAGDRARVLDGADGRALPVRLARRAAGDRLRRAGAREGRVRTTDGTEEILPGSPRSRSAATRRVSSSRSSRAGPGRRARVRRRALLRGARARAAVRRDARPRAHVRRLRRAQGARARGGDRRAGPRPGRRPAPCVERDAAGDASSRMSATSS